MEAYAACGSHAVVTGWAGLRLLGGGFFDGLGRDGKTRLPVPIAADGGRVRSREGLMVLGNHVPDDEIVVIHGMRCAVAERSLLDEVRCIAMVDGDDWDQVVAVDMTCAAQLTSIRRMARYRWTRYWYRDIRTLDRILPLCDEDARSRREVDFRRVWTQHAGWPHPLCNRSVLDPDGKLVGMPDLLDPVRRVAGEYGGGGHRDKGQHDSDVSRTARFRRVGLEVVEVTATHIAYPDRVVSWMLEAEERAVLLPQQWHLAPPPPSLDDILDRRHQARSA